VPLEGADYLPHGRVPHLQLPFQLPVWRERRGSRPALVYRPESLVELPPPHASAADQEPAVGAEGHALRAAGMGRERAELRTGGHVPDPHRPVPRGTGQSSPVGAEGHAHHTVRVPHEGEDLQAGGDVPHLHARTERGTAGQSSPVAAEGHALDPVAVAAEGARAASAESPEVAIFPIAQVPAAVGQGVFVALVRSLPRSSRWASPTWAAWRAVFSRCISFLTSLSCDSARSFCFSARFPRFLRESPLLLGLFLGGGLGAGPGVRRVARFGDLCGEQDAADQQTEHRQQHRAQQGGQRGPPPRPLDAALPETARLSLDGLPRQEAPQVVGQGQGAAVAPLGFLVQALEADRLQVARQPPG